MGQIKLHILYFLVAVAALPIVVIVLPACSAFSPSFSNIRPQKSAYKHSRLFLSSSPDNNTGNDAYDTAAEVEPIYETVVKMDDGGSDLTDRFKYKVNALMGVFDPQTGVDDEQATGNILNALRTFPLRYTFNCVGRTNGDDTEKEEYAREIKRIVSSLSGDEEGVELQITPRGKNFTRIAVDVTVDSVAIINSIYEALEKNEKTLMQY
jgi:putative lipoic acid-binding regulatory protein